MLPPRFLQHKIEAQIRTNGTIYEFEVIGEDSYHQQTVEGEKIKINGIYHEQNSFITVSSSEGASIVRKKSPMILTLMNDDVRKLTQGSIVLINDVAYTVSGILDIQNYGVVADISLEMKV